MLLLFCSGLFCLVYPYQSTLSKVSITMPAWDEKKHIDLLLAFHESVKGETGFQDRIVAAMQAKGYDDSNWDMIR
jgi:hypothetical protein